MTGAKWFDTYVMRNASVRVVILFFFHLAVFSGVYALAWLIRFDFAIPQIHVPALVSSLPFVVGIHLIAGFGFGFYRGWWRYVGLSDVIQLVFGITLALLICLGLWYIDDRNPLGMALAGVSRAALMINWAFALLFLFGARIAVRIGRDRIRAGEPETERRRVLIIGAGDAGETLVREIHHRPQLHMTVAAFVDDHSGKWGSRIRGVPVAGPIASIASIAERYRVNEALLAIPSATGAQIRSIVDHLAESGIRFRTIPGLDQLVRGDLDLSQLRPVNVDDLLRRGRINLPGDPVRDLFAGRRVMVTGAGGTIGTELCRQLLGLGPESLIAVDRSELALYDLEKTMAKEFPGSLGRLTTRLLNIGEREPADILLGGLEPEIVLHAAAHKHVPMGESNGWEYVRNNALVAHAFASQCADAGVAKFIFVSTDKAINPTSIMGASKRAGEILLLELASRHPMVISVVRFGNVIGSSGSVIPLFIEQIRNGGPVTVTHPDVTRYFLRTSEAVSLVLQAATFADSGRVYMLDMGDPIRIVDLAKDLIRLSESSPRDIEIVFTGLRPGEKLFEELRIDGERTHPTPHPQIAVTEAPQPSSQAIARWLQAAQQSGRRSRETTISFLQGLLDEYEPATNGSDGDGTQGSAGSEMSSAPDQAGPSA